MYHTPSRILATHICTFAQSPRSGDVGAYVVARPELGRRSKPERAGEVAIQLTKYDEWCGRNARNLPDQNAVQHWRVFLEQSLQFQVSCMGLPAFHEDGQHTVAANAEDTLEEARGHDIETCREARTASTEDRWGSTRQCLDLQAHRR